MKLVKVVFSYQCGKYELFNMFWDNCLVFWKNISLNFNFILYFNINFSQIKNVNIKKKKK